MSRGRPQGDVPYGTPKVLPVDAHYRITPAGHAGLRRRRRLHGFDLLAPALTDELDGARESRATPIAGLRQLRLTLRRPRRLAPGVAFGLPDLPVDGGGLVAAEVIGEGRVRVLVAGEPLPGPRRASWRLRPPLFGPPALVASSADATVEAVRLWTYRPTALEVLDRYALHHPARVEREYRVPFAPWRRGTAIEQVAIHWGSVEYEHPDVTRPLVAWGYPYYLDGVLGDVDAFLDGHRRQLARGKFLEFDEVENLRCAPPAPADAISIHLRRRELLVPPPLCRLAAVEVRYRTPRRFRPHRQAMDTWVKKGQSAAIPLPRAAPLHRVDVVWSDRGPAMGALSVGPSRSRFVNVCSGERRVFTYLYASRRTDLRLHAREADLHLERVDFYFAD